MVFKEIAAYFILLPISIGVLKLKPASYLERSVLVFLCFGFAIDYSILSRWLPNLDSFLVSCYSLVEALFFLFFIYATTQRAWLRKVCVTLSVVFIVWWVLAYLLLINYNAMLVAMANYFDVAYEFSIAILSAIALLKMNETPTANSASHFWFLLSNFIYCACTFFIAAFIKQSNVSSIWFIHDGFNIICYLILSIGFLSIRTKSQSQ